MVLIILTLDYSYSFQQRILRITRIIQITMDFTDFFQIRWYDNKKIREISFNPLFYHLSGFCRGLLWESALKLVDFSSVLRGMCRRFRTFAVAIT